MGRNRQEENAVNRIDYLPLGSVVLLHGGIQKLLIIARGINTNQGGQTVFFDYGAVLYPEGLIGDRMAYFSHDAVSKVVFFGYDDEESKICTNNINNYLVANPHILRGNHA